MVVNSFARLVATAAVLTTGAVAHADAPDDQFLQLLSKDGITAGPPEQLIALAHERCDDDGLSRDTQRNWIWFAHPSPYAQAMWKIDASWKNRVWRLGRWGRSCMPP